MDAHYDMVMQAREHSGAGKRWYFAYSTILDREAFLEWRAQHSYGFFDLPEGKIGAALDQRLVFDFPSRWWGGRVAGLEAAPGERVWGRVFEISEKDWPVVQHKEGGITQMSVEIPVRVEVDGSALQATAFATNPARRSTDGEVSRRFVEALKSGAEQAGLPAAWKQVLGAL